MDKEIFHEKLCKYKDTVFRVAFSYCKNKSDAEDISQEVFLKYYTSPPDIEEESEEKAWLIRVAINKSKDLIKSSWYSKRCDKENLQETCQMNESQSELLEVVLNLLEKYKIPIYLYYYEQYTIAEISKIMGIKASTIQTRLQRGRKLIEKKLKEEEEYEQSIIRYGYEQSHHEP